MFQWLRETLRGALAPKDIAHADWIDEQLGGGLSSGGGGTSYIAPATYSGSQTDYDGSVTGVPGTIYQIGPTGAISIIYRPPAPPTGPDANGDGLDDSTGRAVGVYSVPTSVSPTGFAYGPGIPVWPNGAPYEAPASGPATRDYSGSMVTLPDGRTVLIDPRTGEIIADYGSKPAAATTQQWGSGSASYSGSGGGGGSAGFASEMEMRKIEAQTDAAIRKAEAEAEAAIRVAQARAQFGDPGDAGALQRLQMQLAAQAAESAANREQAAAQFERTFGLSLQQFQASEARAQRQDQLSAIDSFREAVTSTDPIQLRAFLAAGGGNLANAFQATPQGALSDAANLPAARILQMLDTMGSTPSPAGGLAGAQAGAGGTTGEGNTGGGLTGGATTPATPAAPAGPQYTPTTGLAAPPEGFETWGDWLKQRYGDPTQQLIGQTVLDPSAVQLTRSGHFDPAAMVINPEIAGVGGQAPQTGPTVVIDSQQALYDYLNRLGARAYERANSARVQPNPYPLLDNARAATITAQDMSAWTAAAPITQKGTDGAWGTYAPDGTYLGPASMPSWVTPPPGTTAAAIDPSAPGGSLATAHNPGGGVTVTASGLYVTPGTTAADGSIAPPIERRAVGGPTRAPIAMTGDANAANPWKGGARPEIILNPTGAPIHVLNAAQTRQALRPQRGLGMAQAMAAQRLPLPMMPAGGAPRGLMGAQRMIPRFAAGTIYDTAIEDGTGVSRRRAGTVAAAPQQQGNITSQAPATTTAPPVTAAPPVTTPTQSPTTVVTPAGPVQTPGTVPTTTTAVPPTPVASNTAPTTTTPAATGGGLAAAQTTTQNAAQTPPAAAAPVVTRETTPTAPVTTPAPATATTTRTEGTAATPATTPAQTPAQQAISGAAAAIGSNADLGITAADLPYLQQVAELREGVSLPEGVSLYDTAWDWIDPTIRESYMRGLQSGYGIPLASSAYEQAKYALPGLSRAQLMLGY